MTSYAEIHLFEERCLCVELETMGVILLLASEKESLDLWRDLMMMALAGDSCCGSSRFCRLGLWQAMRGEKVLATRDASFRLWWFIQLVQGAKQ